MGLAIRSFVWGICLAIVLLHVGTACASAPICDETASSRIAPPPVLPIRDVKLEVGSPCDAVPPSEAPVTVTPRGSHAPASPAVSAAVVATEAWVRPVDATVIAPLGRHCPIRPDAFRAEKPGFIPGVFRPPRG